MLVDLHSEYGCYLGDLSHNYVIGKCPPELKAFNDVYEQLCYTLVDNWIPGRTFGECYKEMNKLAKASGYEKDLFFGLGHGIGCIGNESWPIVTFGREWGDMVFEEGMVEIAAVVFNNPKIGGLRLESPTLITNKGAEVLPKTQFEVDYV